MDTWTWLMIDGEITPIWVPSKQVVLLFIYDQFLQGETSFNIIVKKPEKGSVNSLQISLCHWAITQQCCFPLKSLNLRADAALAPVESRAAIEIPSVQHIWDKVDCQARIWCNYTHLTHNIRYFMLLHIPKKATKLPLTSISLSPFITSRCNPAGGLPALKCKKHY